MNLIGFLSVFAITTGMLFKVMHWPWSGIILVLGVFLLNVGFLPMYFFDRYKKAVN